MEITLKVETLSPLHLGSGHADVNVDADVVCDAYGMPYFPARRFKGLVYESALEVAEMEERSGLALFGTDALAALFHHGTDASDAQLIFSNLYIAEAGEYRRMQATWAYLEEMYGGLLTPQDLLEEYTSIRYQTRLEDGVAADGSLRNLRVVDAGVTFYGTMELRQGDAYLPLVAAALRNLKEVGGKRSRGFGRIRCMMELPDGRTGADILEEVLA